MSDHAELEFGGPLPRAAYHALLTMLTNGPDGDLDLDYMIKPPGCGSDHPYGHKSPEEERGWWNMQLTEVGLAKLPVRLGILADCGEGEEYDPAHFDGLVKFLQQHGCYIRRKQPMYFDSYNCDGPCGGSVTLEGPNLKYEGTASIDADDDPAVEVDVGLAQDLPRLATAALRAWYIVNYPIPPLTVVEDGSTVETTEPEAADA